MTDAHPDQGRPLHDRQYAGERQQPHSACDDTSDETRDHRRCRHRRHEQGAGGRIDPFGAELCQLRDAPDLGGHGEHERNRGQDEERRAHRDLVGLPTGHFLGPLGRCAAIGYLTPARRIGPQRDRRDADHDDVHHGKDRGRVGHAAAVDQCGRDDGEREAAHRQSGRRNRQGNRPSDLEPAGHQRGGGHQTAETEADREDDVARVQREQARRPADEPQAEGGDQPADRHDDAEVAALDHRSDDAPGDRAHDEEQRRRQRDRGRGESLLLGDRLEIDRQSVEAEARVDHQHDEDGGDDVPTLEDPPSPDHHAEPKPDRAFDIQSSSAWVAGNAPWVYLVEIPVAPPVPGGPR